MTISFRPKEYFRPHGMDEAIGILSRFGSKGKAIAGGTDLLVQKPNDVECLIDISSLGFQLWMAIRRIRLEKNPFFLFYFKCFHSFQY